MARQMITLTDGGFDAWIDELNTAVEEMPEIMLAALKARQTVIEKAIQNQWVSMGGSPGGFVHSSIGQSATFSKQNPVDVVGTVGVYDIDSVKLSFGKTDKDLNAAQISYWVEHGTTRIKAGGRKVKGVEYPDEMLITVSPKPFISQGVYTSWSDAEQAFREKFNEEYTRRVK